MAFGSRPLTRNNGSDSPQRRFMDNLSRRQLSRPSNMNRGCYIAALSSAYNQVKNRSDEVAPSVTLLSNSAVGLAAITS